MRTPVRHRKSRKLLTILFAAILSSVPQGFKCYISFIIISIKYSAVIYAPISKGSSFGMHTPSVSSSASNEMSLMCRMAANIASIPSTSCQKNPHITILFHINSLIDDSVQLFLKLVRNCCFQFVLYLCAFESKQHLCRQPKTSTQTR